MSGLVAVKHIRSPASLLNNVGSTVDPSSSLLNFKHVITGVVAVLQINMLIFFLNTLTYFDYDMKIQISDCWTSNPRNNLLAPNHSFQIHFQ